MFAKSALAATAFFALTAAFLPGQQASANTQVGVGIGFGYGYGDYNNDDYDEIRLWQCELLEGQGDRPLAGLQECRAV